MTTTYEYNKAGQPSKFTVGRAVHSPYFYNGFRQLASRQVTAGQPTSRIHMIYDLDGNLLAEANSDGVVQREYVWLAGRPIAVFDDASGTPVSRYVHVDHLDRPLMMTNPGGASVWRAIYRPFGEVHQIIGVASMAEKVQPDARGRALIEGSDSLSRPTVGCAFRHNQPTTAHRDDPAARQR